MAHGTATPPPGTTIPLSRILEGIDYTCLGGSENVVDKLAVRSICSDSRNLEQGDLFIAFPGASADGREYLDAVVSAGCSAVLIEGGCDWQPPPDWQGCALEVSDGRAAYAVAAANYFGRPADSLKLIAITGTNGKTTVSYLLEEALEQLGKQVGVIGTVNYRYARETEKIILPSQFTTPEPMKLQELLFTMAAAGVEYVIMEISSHALAQRRIGDTLFDVAVFTNLSHDHLDYHIDMEEYFQAKARLFSSHLKPGGQVIVCRSQHDAGQTDWGLRVTELCASLALSTTVCGTTPDSDIQVVDHSSSLNSSVVHLRIAHQTFACTTPLVGRFNIDNLVVAVATLCRLGIEIEQVFGALRNAAGAPGRLERVTVDGDADGNKPVVFVDYAHTPEALRQVLLTLSALPHNDLFCVFGCGGDRDQGKRPAMGSIAAEYADVAIVTDDNPRTEEPAVIREQVVKGVLQTGYPERDRQWLAGRSRGEQGFINIARREEAIEAAVRGAHHGDIVLIAGKGHEKYQLGLHGKRFFDDCLEAQTALLAWSLDTVAAATGGKVVSAVTDHTVLEAVSTDSRTIEPGDIFLALRGEKFDGHQYLSEVMAKGAGCCVVDAGSALVPSDCLPRVEVDDTLKALGDLARYRRLQTGRLQNQVVAAVTGSCGKTTVKEMTAAIFRRIWPAGPDHPEEAVLATRGNLNNLIGLPLSLLPISPKNRAAVLEMGMNVPGEIETMVDVAVPDICCITNVYGVHLEGLQTIAGVAAAKEELFAAAPASAVLAINVDDRYVREMADRYSQQQIRYSLQCDTEAGGVDLCLSDLQALPGGALTFTLHRWGEVEHVHLYTAGRHNAANALAAASIATAAGATLAQIGAGLADFRPADRRMVLLRTQSGVGVINDTYNANPASMEAGLRTLVQQSEQRTAALLGDMLELGEVSIAAHRQLGALAGELGVDFLGVVGGFKEHVCQGAIARGMAPERVRQFENKDKAAEWIEKMIRGGELGNGDWLLVKASRGLQMETIVERLTGKA